MSLAPIGSAEVNSEALKLLVQVAAANDHVHDHERDFLRGLAAAWGVAEIVTRLLEQLDRGERLDQPNVALLRGYANEVVHVAEALVRVDGEVDHDEHHMLFEVKAMLGV